MSNNEESAEQGHYFSPKSGSPLKLREIEVELAGKTLAVNTAKGLFSFDGLDKATGILLSHDYLLPEIPANGRVLDLGCGWGPIALSLALQRPDLQVFAVDINNHARQVTAMNASRLGLNNIHVHAPDEVDPNIEFDAIWSNPPIRIGKVELHAILRRWLGQLKADGTASMVVGKNLGSDSLAKWIEAEFPNRTVNKAHSSKGFRLLVVE